MEQLARRVVGGLNELICIRCFECCQEYQCVVIITTTSQGFALGSHKEKMEEDKQSSESLRSWARGPSR